MDLNSVLIPERIWPPRPSHYINTYLLFVEIVSKSFSCKSNKHPEQNVIYLPYRLVKKNKTINYLACFLLAKYCYFLIQSVPIKFSSSKSPFWQMRGRMFAISHWSERVRDLFLKENLSPFSQLQLRKYTVLYFLCSCQDKAVTKDQ